MMPADRDDVRRAVFESLEDVTGVSQRGIREDRSLLRDLEMTGDDFTFVFVPAVERTLGVKTQPAVWSKVSTVGEAIEVFSQALAQQGGR